MYFYCSVDILEAVMKGNSEDRQPASTL